MTAPASAAGEAHGPADPHGPVDPAVYDVASAAEGPAGSLPPPTITSTPRPGPTAAPFPTGVPGPSTN